MRPPFHRYFRERGLRKRFEPLRHALEQELGAFLGYACQLLPIRGKGGYDRLYQVVRGGECVAMMRVKNPDRLPPVNAPDSALRRALAPDERLKREWTSYTKLAPLRLSPTPLWRSPEAIVATYHAGERVSNILKRKRGEVWNLIPRLFTLVWAMHDTGVTHMDLNLGNILCEYTTGALLALDFEYAPADILSFEEACLCDYLHITNDLLRPRRGGRFIKRQPERFVDLARPYLIPLLSNIRGNGLFSRFPQVAATPEIAELFQP